MDITENTYEDILKLQRAVESSGEAIFITDLNGLITYINPEFTNLYGFTADEVIGKSTPRILKSGVMAPENYKYFWETILNKKVVRGELVNKTKDGRLLTVDGSANPILNDRDEIIGFIGIQHDITSRKLSEEALKQSEEKFRKAFMTSPDSVNINRLTDGMYVSINEGFTKNLGFSEDEVVGKTSLELDIWADQEDRNKLVNEIRERGSVNNFETIFRKKDGSIVYGSMSASLIDLDGVPHILSVTRDITSRRQVEEALSREQFFINALMNNLTDYIYIKDVESRFLRINKSHATVLGLDDPDQVIGKTDNDFYSKEHAQQAYDDEQTIVRTGQTMIKEEKLTHLDNSDTWVSSIKMPLLDNDGKIIGTFGISRDITEQKKSEEQLFMLANALKSINECVSITDMNDKVLFLNQAFMNTYGFNESDLKEESIGFIRSLNNPPDLVNEILPATLRGGWHGELLNRKKDGTEFLVSLSTAIVKNLEGQPISMIGVASDITERKKTEEALKHSEERFRSVTQSATDAIVTVDSKGNILGWNSGAEKTFGYEASQIIGQSLNIIIPEDYLEMHIKGMNRLEMGGEKHVIGKTVELHGLKKNGHGFPLELSLSEWETSEGKFFTGIIRDISRRRRTELENQVIYEITQGITTTSNLDELLKLMHSSLRKVVYAENCFVALYHQKTGLFSFPYFVDKFDMTPLPSSMGKSCTEYVFKTVKPFLFTEEDFNKLWEQNEVELVGSASPSWIGIPLQTPQKVIGVLVLQHYDKANVYSDNDLRFLVSIGNQIALAIERKQAESELLESEKNLNESQAIAGLGSYKLDFNLGLWTSSPILDSIFGIEENYDKSVIGWSDLIHTSWRERMSEYLRKEVIENNNRFDKEYKIVRKSDGNERWVHGLGELVYDSNKKLAYMVGTIMDITQRKQSEEEIILKNEQLQLINAEKDKFFSILAHDLRGPLSAFVAATQILTEEIQNMGMEDIKDITLSMKTSATNIYSLLENLLEWSRLKRGGLDFVPDRLNLKKKISACSDLLHESAIKKRIEVAILIPDEMEVFADNHMFDAIVRNLLSNAIKFTSVGGSVSVKAAYFNEHFIEVDISDSGIGMTLELKNKLFQINEKTSRPGTAGEPSTGLGLLLCKEFIEKHGGKIWIESEVGKGSTFTFTIPIMSKE